MTATELDGLTVHEVIAGALADPDPEGEARWAALVELQRRGDDATLHAALALCRGDDPARRRLGAGVLGQLGFEKGRPYLEESLPALLSLAEEDPDPVVIADALTALGHLRDGRALDAVLRHTASPEVAIRFSAAWALPSVCGAPPDPRAIDALLRLMEDLDTHVRDWATFGVGSQLEELDTPAIRDALAARLEDADAETREEAIRGLATRRDPRAFAAVAALLEEDDCGLLVIEAAASLADPRLLPRLLALAGQADDRVLPHVRGALAGAIAACQPPEEPG